MAIGAWKPVDKSTFIRIAFVAVLLVGLLGSGIFVEHIALRVRLNMVFRCLFDTYHARGAAACMRLATRVLTADGFHRRGLLATKGLFAHFLKQIFTTVLSLCFASSYNKTS